MRTRMYRFLEYFCSRINVYIEIHDTITDRELSCLQRGFRVKTFSCISMHYSEKIVSKSNIRILLHGEEHHTTTMYEVNQNTC
jgi:hypothetical protein